MDTVRLSLQGAWALLYTGLILGAGLPIMFALGVRLWAGLEVVTVDGESTDASISTSPGLVRKTLAALCFAVVLFGVVTGLMIIIGVGLGKEVSFDHIYPTLVPKS